MLVLICLILDIVFRKYEHNLPLYITSGLTYFLGFFLWNVDNKFCGYLRYVDFLKELFI